MPFYALAIPSCFASGSLSAFWGLTSEEDRSGVHVRNALRRVSFCGVCTRDHPISSRGILITVLFAGANPGPIVGDVRKSSELVMTTIKR